MANLWRCCSGNVILLLLTLFQAKIVFTFLKIIALCIEVTLFLLYFAVHGVFVQGILSDLCSGRAAWLFSKILLWWIIYEPFRWACRCLRCRWAILPFASGFSSQALANRGWACWHAARFWFSANARLLEPAYQPDVNALFTSVCMGRAGLYRGSWTGGS